MAKTIKTERQQILDNLFPEGSRVTAEVKEALVRMGFMTAPASANHHGKYAGGLFDHSFNVAVCLERMTKSLSLKWGDPESPRIIGMLHDLCKCDQYVQLAPFTETYAYNTDMLLTGHAEKSLMLIGTLMPLTE